MELGQRLRQLRMEQGLSQRQLCGDVITRNMLSQIENGTARPSMDTLLYLSSRLGKPVSYFLEEEERQIPNLPIIEQARCLYAQRQWTQLLSQLQQYREDAGCFDEERWLLQALCLMELAAESEDATYAMQLLEEAAEAGKRTPYYTDCLEQKRLLCLAEVSPDAAVPGNDREMMLRAERLLNEEKFEQAAVLLDCCDDRASSRWHLLRGETAYGLKVYSEAVNHFRLSEGEYPSISWKRLEECYGALEDYKLAYEYACKRRELTCKKP